MSPSISYTYCIPNPILGIMEEEGRKMKKEKMNGKCTWWRKEEKWGKKWGLFTMNLPCASFYTKYHGIDMNTYYNTMKLDSIFHFTDEDKKIWKDVVSSQDRISNTA